MGRHKAQLVPDGTTKKCRVHGVLDIMDICKYKCHGDHVQIGCRICRNEQARRVANKRKERLGKSPKVRAKKANEEINIFAKKMEESVETKRVVLKVNKMLNKLNRS